MSSSSDSNTDHDIKTAFDWETEFDAYIEKAKSKVSKTYVPTVVQQTRLKETSHSTTPRLIRNLWNRKCNFDQPFLFRFTPAFTSDGSTSISQVYLAGIFVLSVALTSISSSVPNSFLIVPASVTFIVGECVGCSFSMDGC